MIIMIIIIIKTLIVCLTFPARRVFLKLLETLTDLGYFATSDEEADDGKTGRDIVLKAG